MRRKLTIYPALIPSFLSLLGFAFSPPAAVHGSPPPTDSLHYCAPFDYEEWRRGHPRPAAKRLADLNVGEPRTVRLIYFRPKDRSYREDVIEDMKKSILVAQEFFAEQMQAHGYGYTTFRIETDAQGKPIVHRFDGQHPEENYHGYDAISETEKVFDTEANVSAVFLDHSSGSVGVGAAGLGGLNVMVISYSGLDPMVIAHELGHAFGLPHDYRGSYDLMSQDRSFFGLDDFHISVCAADHLSVNPFFNPDIPIKKRGQESTIELISPPEYPEGSKSVSIRLDIGDSEGIYLVTLVHDWGSDEGVVRCRKFAGELNAIVEFEYDGDPALDEDLSDRPFHNFEIQVLDALGNTSYFDFGISAVDQLRIALIERDKSWTHALAFSPDGKTLAECSSVDDGFRSCVLWDVETREQIAELNHPDNFYSLSFSPDGTILATGGAGRSVLWDVETKERIAEPNHIGDLLSFSPDGTILATGWSEEVVLWDVETGERIAELNHLGKAIRFLSFSPDGTTLATGAATFGAAGWEEVVLWDLETRGQIAELIPNDALRMDRINSISFSPDGAILALGGARYDHPYFYRHEGEIIFWDVENKELVGSLPALYEIESVTFSPDGTQLASGANEGQVILWDVLTKEQIKMFAFPAMVEPWDVAPPLSFSPDGATLAIGSHDIQLFDISEWVQIRPFNVEIISGDGQQGRPGAALAHPLVVEVRDQYGNPFPGAPVTFTVTGGGGHLSDRFTSERAITDADGRADRILTLSAIPGKNTVGVSIEGTEVATFHAEGVGTAMSAMEGDFQTWHLPEGARLRLEKGHIPVGYTKDKNWLVPLTGNISRWPAPLEYGYTRWRRLVLWRCCLVTVWSCRWGFLLTVLSLRG